MDQILEVLSLFLSVENILMIALGVVIGVVIGAIPGLTATMAVALALPFTFGMEPVTAILLLVGIYKGGMYGGSITAILIRTPGSPASAAPCWTATRWRRRARRRRRCPWRCTRPASPTSSPTCR